MLLTCAGKPITRAQESELISKALKKVPNGQKSKCILVLDDPIFEEIHVRAQSGGINQMSEGIGYDEAKTKCGNSEEQLNEAVREGRCIRVGTGPTSAYFFRKVVVNFNQTWSTTEKTKQTGIGDQAMLDNAQSATASMLKDVADFAAAPGESLGPGFCNNVVGALNGNGLLQVGDLASSSKQADLQVLKGKLDEATKLLGNTITLAERCRENTLISR